MGEHVGLGFAVVARGVRICDGFEVKKMGRRFDVYKVGSRKSEQLQRWNDLNLSCYFFCFVSVGAGG